MASQSGSVAGEAGGALEYILALALAGQAAVKFGKIAHWDNSLLMAMDCLPVPSQDLQR